MSPKRYTDQETFVCIVFYRCSTDDTAQYTAVAGNSHGQASSQASVIVKSKSLPLPDISDLTNCLAVIVDLSSSTFQFEDTRSHDFHI